MFTSQPPTCTGRTLDLSRKDKNIRDLRHLGNSDIANKEAWTRFPPHIQPRAGLSSTSPSASQVDLRVAHRGLDQHLIGRYAEELPKAVNSLVIRAWIVDAAHPRTERGGVQPDGAGKPILLIIGASDRRAHGWANHHAPRIRLVLSKKSGSTQIVDSYFLRRVRVIEAAVELSCATKMASVMRAGVRAFGGAVSHRFLSPAAVRKPADTGSASAKRSHTWTQFRDCRRSFEISRRRGRIRANSLRIT